MLLSNFVFTVGLNPPVLKISTILISAQTLVPSYSWVARLAQDLIPEVNDTYISCWKFDEAVICEERP
jgi:hypothetical protein